MSGEDTREALVEAVVAEIWGDENTDWIGARDKASIRRSVRRALSLKRLREAASRLAAPVGETGQRCNRCGHQWNGPAQVVLCGDCWRKTWPFIWGGVNAEAAPPPPAEARERVIDDAEATGDPAKVALAGYVRLADAYLQRRREALVAEINSVAGEISAVASHYEKRKVVPLTADERQMLARLTMWRKRLREAADHLAALVGEQEQAMPPIEVGDWVRWVWDTPLAEVEDVAIVKTKSQVERLGKLSNERMIEIRKADGRVWRRNG